MPHRLILTLITAALLTTANAQITIDVQFGTSATLPTTLHITQNGHPDTLITNVHYQTRAWLPPTNLALITQNYYTLRIGYFPKQNPITAGYELEVLHDKVYYARGNDPERIIGHFELSDGVNYLLVNAAVRYAINPNPEYPAGQSQVLARIGAGPVITAPATTIRGESQGHEWHGTIHPYEFAGMGVQAAIQARHHVLPWLALSGETKLTYSNPKQSISGGMSQTPLPTVHLNFGVSITPKPRK